MPHQDAARRWYPLVREAQESAQPLTVIARRHGVNAKTLGWWKLRFERGEVEQPDAFIEVHVHHEQPRPTMVVLRFEQRDLTMEVSSDIDPTQFQQLVGSLC